MKVIRLTTSLGFGGVEKRLELVAKFSKTRAKATYIFMALHYGGITEKRISQLGYPVICLNQSPTIPNLSLIRSLYNIFKREKPDVVHTSGAEANFHGLLAAFLAGVPVRIGEEIGIPDHSKKAEYIFRAVYKTATAVIGISEAVKSHINKIKEVPAAKTVVVHNPVAIEQVQDTVIKNSIFTIVVVCRLFAVKNLFLLLKAVKALTNQGQDVHLWIVGEGPQHAELNAFVLQEGIADHVTFWGFQERPIDFVSKADLFVLPSFSEGFAIALVEAMLLGIPSVATNVGGPVEIISHGVNGWLIDPLQEKAFIQTLSRIIELDPDERRKIGQAGKLHVEVNFSPDIHLTKLENLYSRLLSA